MLLSFHQCTVANRGNQKKTLKKALKNDTLSVADFLKNIEIRKPKYSDTTTLNTFSTQFELGKNLIEKLQLKNSHLKAKKYYVQYRIDFSKKFNSIIISASRNQEMYNYIINYDSNDKITANVRL